MPYIWETTPSPPREMPPWAEIEACLRDADADMPAHIEDFTDQRAYLATALRQRWPELTASDALVFVKRYGH